MKKKLTPKIIDALPPAVNKRHEVHDALLPGLHLHVSATEERCLMCRVDGRMKRIRIQAHARDMRNLTNCNFKESLVAEEGLEPPTRGL